jgi:mannose-6-phosphate isomerase-like protein (cupin superfamily)
MIRSARRDAAAYKTRDGSLIRELMHPDVHGNRCQSLAEATLRPGQTTLAHRHARTEEIYYILKGEALMSVDHEKMPVGRGDAVLIPPGSWHCITNTGIGDLVWLCCCAPAYRHDDTQLLPPEGDETMSNTPSDGVHGDGSRGDRQ